MTISWPPRTWVQGELVTAAMMNEQIRDSVLALYPYTATGDLAYAGTGATELARLAIGEAGQVLKVNSAGSAPEWGAGGIKLYTFTRTGELTTTSKTYVDITDASVDVDVILTSSILMITSFSSAIIGSSSNTLVVAANIGGNVVSTIHNTGIGTGDKYKPGALVGWKTGVEAGTVTCKLQWLVGGDTGYIKLINGAVLVIPE